LSILVTLLNLQVPKPGHKNCEKENKNNCGRESPFFKKIKLGIIMRADQGHVDVYVPSRPAGLIFSLFPALPYIFHAESFLPVAITGSDPHYLE